MRFIVHLRHCLCDISCAFAPGNQASGASGEAVRKAMTGMRFSLNSAVIN